MKKHTRNLRVTLSSQHYGNYAYCPLKTNVATQKQINYFDWLFTTAKENGVLNDEMEQRLKRMACTKKGFSTGIYTLKTLLKKANISYVTGERISEDSPYYFMTYNLADGERKAE